MPNALVFIDKYTQIFRILLPITTTILQLEKCSGTVKSYLDTHFGGIEAAKKLILCDFFRHAFDGSGADK